MIRKKNDILYIFPGMLDLESISVPVYLSKEEKEAILYALSNWGLSEWLCHYILVNMKKENDMSIIIKGVDLPENFEAIAIITKNETKGEPNCKADTYYSPSVIQIPKGHGDIVDRDEMIIRQDIESDRGTIGYYEAINNDVDVLLESEEE